jgi:predicted unusual protein kinase regulating ubiquinone biosynthesis (AarF/ABC1/UbiB family)
VFSSAASKEVEEDKLIEETDYLLELKTKFEEAVRLQENRNLVFPEYPEFSSEKIITMD